MNVFVHRQFSALTHKMEILSINEIKFLAKLRNVDGYEIMFRKQPKSIFAKPFAFEPILKAEPKSALGAKMISTTKEKSKYISKAEAKGKSKTESKSTTPEPILNLDNVDELEKVEAT